MKKVALTLLLLLLVPAVYAGDGMIHKKPGAELVKDSYIVLFQPGEPNPAERANELARIHGGTVNHVYRHALLGAHFLMTEGQAQGMAHNPHVARVEQDSLAYVVGDQSPATWGIDRVDQRDLPLSNSYHWDYDGTGVRAFILDTGVRETHVDFGGRASWGIDCTGEGVYDGHGHGTHVAGTVGSATYGVAKNVTLIAVKICTSGGSCPGSAILCGIDYATGQKQNYPSIPMVANMSIGGPYDQTMTDAVTNSVAAGIFYAVAAGDSSADACNYSPSSTPVAYTIGATTSLDARSSFSNYGTCLDIFAPGSSILSTYNSSNTATTTMSGTSMASPHACGAGALVFDEHPTWTAFQVMAELDARATLDRLTGVGTGSRNALLYTLLGCSCTPVPRVDAGPDRSIRLGQSTNIGTSLREGHSYSWSPGGETTAVITVSPYTTTTYTVTADTVCGSANDSVTVTVLPAGAGLSDDFEGGAGSWTATGLWHIANSCAGTGSGSNAFYYGQDGSCNYNTGSTNSGSLTSPNVTGITSASTLTFNYRRQVESYSVGDYDVTEVLVNGTTVWRKTSRDASADAWLSSGAISLAAFAGQTIQVEFRFDTVDSAYNTYRGWAIDDVVVTGTDELAITKGLDFWETPEGDAKITLDLPADFFCSGSSPVYEPAFPLKGEPLVTSPKKVLGATDTVLDRQSDATFTGDVAQTQLIIRALSLVSVNPLAVPDCQPDQNQWDVKVSLDGPQTGGTITITKDDPLANGGIFDAEFDVRGNVRFINVADPGVILGPVPDPDWPQTVTTTGAFWSSTFDGNGPHYGGPVTIDSNGNGIIDGADFVSSYGNIGNFFPGWQRGLIRFGTQHQGPHPWTDPSLPIPRPSQCFDW